MRAISKKNGIRLRMSFFFRTFAAKLKYINEKHIRLWQQKKLKVERRKAKVHPNT